MTMPTPQVSLVFVQSRIFYSQKNISLDYVQVWFSVAAAPLETDVYTADWWTADAAALPDCSEAFRACFAASAGPSSSSLLLSSLVLSVTQSL